MECSIVMNHDQSTTLSPSQCLPSHGASKSPAIPDPASKRLKTSQIGTRATNTGSDFGTAREENQASRMTLRTGPNMPKQSIMRAERMKIF